MKEKKNAKATLNKELQAKVAGGDGGFPAVCKVDNPGEDGYGTYFSPCCEDAEDAILRVNYINGEGIFTCPKCKKTFECKNFLYDPNPQSQNQILLAFKEI